MQRSAACRAPFSRYSATPQRRRAALPSVPKYEGRMKVTRLLYARAISSVVGGTWGRNDVAIRSHTLQKFEEVATRGKDKGRVFGDDGLVRLHGPCEFIERHRFRALVVSLRVDFGGFRVCHAPDLLDLPVGFRLDLV